MKYSCYTDKKLKYLTAWFNRRHLASPGLVYFVTETWCSKCVSSWYLSVLLLLLGPPQGRGHLLYSQPGSLPALFWPGYKRLRRGSLPRMNVPKVDKNSVIWSASLNIAMIKMLKMIEKDIGNYFELKNQDEVKAWWSRDGWCKSKWPREQNYSTLISPLSFLSRRMIFKMKMAEQT